MPEKRLLLLRHAKSSWATEGVEDHDRPLAPRGDRAAVLVGTYLAQEEIRPDLVLCSTALRARQTAERVLAQCAPEAPVQYVEGLYLATPRQIRSVISGVAETCGVLLVVGHNPGLHEFACLLAAAGAPEALARLQHGMPTAALAAFALAARWRDVDGGPARLLSFVVPKTLI